MSDNNSDEIASKVVSKLLTAALLVFVGWQAAHYLAGIGFQFWMIFPAIFLYGLVHALWDELTGPESAAHKIGKVTTWIGSIAGVGGVVAAYFGYRDILVSYAIVGGFGAGIIGYAIREFTSRIEIRNQSDEPPKTTPECPHGTFFTTVRGRLIAVAVFGVLLFGMYLLSRLA
jgi:hypothetical protein